jgi:hypothetical protein
VLLLCWSRRWGLSDDDLRLSLNNLNYMASALKATATIARLFQGAMGRSCALVKVRRDCVEDVHYLEMRVAGALSTVLHSFPPRVFGRYRKERKGRPIIAHAVPKPSDTAQSDGLQVPVLFKRSLPCKAPLWSWVYSMDEQRC